MLFLLGSLLVGTVVSLALYLPNRDNIDFIDYPMFAGAIAFVVCMFAIPIFAEVIYNNSYVENKEVVYEIRKDSGYYDISSNGNVSVSILNKNGEWCPESYDKDIVKFTEGDSAKVKVVYPVHDWSDSEKCWFGMWGFLVREKDDTPTDVTIYLPKNELEKVENDKDSAYVDIGEDVEIEKIEEDKDENISDVKFCTSCGKEKDESDVYCRYCGEKLKKE